MSARREKRLRRLEARIIYLEGRVHSVEKRQMDQEEMPDTISMGVELRSRPTLLERLKGLFK